jgi:hypothetical protein
MDEASAVTLLMNKLGRLVDSKDATELAIALDFMPLAIVQATAYISHQKPGCSVQQYLADFKNSDQKKKRGLLSREGGGLRRGREAKNSIILSWQLSFYHIRKTRLSAADLLCLISFFDRQGIPQALLRNQERGVGLKGK